MIDVRNAHKDLGEFSLHGVDLHVPVGEYFVVLGPTGSGKTVLLECIAGLYTLDDGEVWLDGRDVTDLPPELRNIGYVPQDYVLFPHLSLQKNIEFSLTVQGADRQVMDSRVRQLSEMLGIQHLLHRRTRTLSGGEQQRGALARALAPSPKVLLLDEPLSALDEGTRAELTVELDRVSTETGTTVIHVCHSLEEALDLGDHAAIMQQGRIEQVGAPPDVFRRPCNEFVARFVGSENLFAVVSVEGSDHTVLLEAGVQLKVARLLQASDLLASIRPEEISITNDAAAGGHGHYTAGTNDINAIPCVLERVEDRGRSMRMHLKGKLDLIVTMTRQVFATVDAKEGDEVVARFDSTSVHLLTP